MADTLATTFAPAAFTHFEYVEFNIVDASSVEFVYRLSSDMRSYLFTERFDFPSGTILRDETHSHSIDGTLRLLWLAAGLSYWKLSGATDITVAGGLASYERHFLSTLIEHGMAEYAYRNNKMNSLRPAINSADLSLPTINQPCPGAHVSDRALVAIGGGKDSVVAIEALKSANKTITGFAVNAHNAVSRTAEVARIPLLNVARTLSPTLALLTQSGGLNGHVPVTAINSLVGVVAAEASGYAATIFANERSASSENLIWNGFPINHQWSKGLQFENLLRTALTAARSGVEYFSLMRPFSEIHIMATFARMTEYHLVFSSCNREHTEVNRHQGRRWCGQCDKCRFVYLALAPYVTPNEMQKIFGSDLFSAEPNTRGFDDLLGLGGHRPFECVGDLNECRQAVLELNKSPFWRDHPFVRKRYGQIQRFPVPTGVFTPSVDHSVPLQYLGALNEVR